MSLAKIPILQIDPGQRGRRDYGDLEEMCHSLKTRGLISPIAVIDKAAAGLTTVGKNDAPYLLAAGGRRIAAASALKWETIECKVFDHELTEDEYLEIELFENLHRKDLTPMERLNMEAKIHELQVKRYGPRISKLPDAPGHSVADTAEMLGMKDASGLHKTLKLKKLVDQFPGEHWDRCKTISDMNKVAKKIQRTVVNTARAETVLKNVENLGDGLLKQIIDSYVVGDFFVKSAELPDASFDLAEIDPPYAINLAAKKKGNDCSGYNEIDGADYPEFMEAVFRRCYEKLKPNSFLICWFGPTWFQTIQYLLRLVGFSTTELVGIWAKGEETDEIISSACGQTHMPNSRLANAYEMFYYAWKGSPELNKPGSSNLFGCVPVPPQRKWHPTQRPRPLIRQLLTTFTSPGSNVLVPFLGSGETVISAYKENMTPVGFELNPAYKDGFIGEVGKEFS